MNFTLQAMQASKGIHSGAAESSADVVAERVKKGGKRRGCASQRRWSRMSEAADFWEDVRACCLNYRSEIFFTLSHPGGLKNNTC